MFELTGLVQRIRRSMGRRGFRDRLVLCVFRPLRVAVVMHRKVVAVIRLAFFCS